MRHGAALKFHVHPIGSDAAGPNHVKILTVMHVVNIKFTIFQKRSGQIIYRHTSLTGGERILNVFYVESLMLLHDYWNFFAVWSKSASSVIDCTGSTLLFAALMYYRNNVMKKKCCVSYSTFVLLEIHLPEISSVRCRSSHRIEWLCSYQNVSVLDWIGKKKVEISISFTATILLHACYALGKKS